MSNSRKDKIEKGVLVTGAVSCFAKAFTECTTWKKRFVLMELAILLCSMLLVTTLPAIATEQTTQKTIASASEDEFTLGIYGNANEDDIIDMRDTTYIKLVIFGKKSKTDLADANNDGKISMLDVGQTKLIILGKEKQLTVIDQADRTVTINMPVERIASSSMPQDIRTICALGVADKIVGVPDAITGDRADRYPAISMAYPELTELPITGSPYYGDPNLEIIVSLEPDLVLASYTDADAIQEATGVPTIDVHTGEPILDFKELRFMSYVLNERGRAEELISYFNEKLDEVTEVTSKIQDDEKPKVYLAFWGKLTWTPAVYEPVGVAGGECVADEGAPGPYGALMWEVSKEQIIAWNPDFIILHCSGTVGSLTTEDVLTDPDLQSVSAVQNETIYSTKGFMFGWDPATGIIESFYLGKLFHPKEFAGVDIEEVGNDILEKVYGADGIWTEMTEMCNIYTW